MIKSICVYCGSSVGNNPAYLAAARETGQWLASRKIRTVYGGGSVGLMGAVADAALGAQGEVIGVIPRFMTDKEVHHTGVTQLIVVESMHERKLKMAELADAFIALPGGFGTLEETIEVSTWTQLGLQRKPVGLLNVSGFYDRLIEFVDAAAESGFIGEENRKILCHDKAIDGLYLQLAEWQKNKGIRHA